MATKKSSRSSSKSGRPRKASSSRKMSRKSPTTWRKRSRKSSSKLTSTVGAQSASITGSFSGSIIAAGRLHIAPGASCQASVNASSVEVDGAVKGRLVAANQMKLGPKSRIRGEIVADRLVCNDGASFHGMCKLGRKAA